MILILATSASIIMGIECAIELWWQSVAGLFFLGPEATISAISLFPMDDAWGVRLDKIPGVFVNQHYFVGHFPLAFSMASAYSNAVSGFGTLTPCSSELKKEKPIMKHPAKKSRRVISL